MLDVVGSLIVSHRPGRRLGSVPVDRGQLVAWLEDAGRDFMALRVSGTAPAGARSGMLPFLRSLDPESWVDRPDPADLQPAPPSAREISSSDEVLGWILLIPLDPARRGSGELHSRHGGAMLRRVVFLRSMINPRTDRHVYSWRHLGRRLGCSHEACRAWHATGIDKIFYGLRRNALDVVDG
jgi:hypothetical protein